MKKVLIICLLFFMFCGCLDMDEQTAYFFYDNQKDEFHLLLQYKGVYSDSNISESEDNLNGFFKPDWEIAFGGWIGHVTKKGIEESLNDENIPENAGKLIKLLLENITVTTGKFFWDKNKHLSYYQIITLKNASKHIELVNKLISELIPGEINRGNEPFRGLDKNSIALIADAFHSSR